MTELNCSHNEITVFHAGAFDYTFKLRSLDLAFNQLTITDARALDNNPALAVFRVNHNSIWAVPKSSNHIEQTSDADANVLTCATCVPGPIVSPAFVFLVHCAACVRQRADKRDIVLGPIFSPALVSLFHCAERVRYRAYMRDDCYWVSSFACPLACPRA